MVLYNDFLTLSDLNKHQIFQRIFMLTLFCTIYSKPLLEQSSNLTNLSSDAQEILTEHQKIIAELKWKILTRLNITDFPSPRKTYNWETIPDDMKNLLDDEVDVEKQKTETENDKVETIITPIARTSCNRTTNVFECFKAILPNIAIKEVKCAKLIAQLLSDEETAFKNVASYNITINTYDMVNDIVVGNNGKNSVEIDLLELFKDLLFDDKVVNKLSKETLLDMSIAGEDSSLPISQVMDLSTMIFEIQYTRPKNVKRLKRSPNMCQPNQYFCCTQTLKVNIVDLQWSHFIVAPRTFTINYCKGDCNNRSTQTTAGPGSTDCVGPKNNLNFENLQNSSNHAKALNLMRNRGLDEKKDTRSCCIPYSFSKLTIMYEAADSTLKVATFNDLIASSCGCL